jgi:hypothetical protein
MKSMYDLYETDSDLEKNGVMFDYGSFRVKLARAGGSNKKYARLLEAKTKPYKRAIQTKTMDDDLANKLLMETFVETCLLSWESQVEEDKWESGILLKDGSLQPLTKESAIQVLKKLPDLYQDMSSMAMEMSNYRQGELETDSKN